MEVGCAYDQHGSALATTMKEVVALETQLLAQLAISMPNIWDGSTATLLYKRCEVWTGKVANLGEVPSMCCNR